MLPPMKTHRSTLIILLVIFLYSASLSGQCIPNFYIHRPSAECLGEQGMKIHYTQEQYIAHDIFRRQVGDTSWGAPLFAGYWGAPTQSNEYFNLIKNYYIATDHQPGMVYEYRIKRTFDNIGSFSGYVLAGCELPPIVDRGNAILLVSQQLSDSIATELETMRRDLIADGYRVYMLEADEAATPPEVKSQIQSIYSSMAGEKVYLYIIGHVPVPYSGHMASDDQPSHRGAWPADVYYGDLNGTYTDFVSNSTEAARPENHNVPGDGKFDQHLISAKPVIAVGRADFSRLNCFTGKTEIDLTKRYLAKDHAFRYGQVSHNGKSLMCDNMEFYYGNNASTDGFIELYAKIGDNNFRALTNKLYPNYVHFTGVRDSLSQASHHFSYISGTSSYTNINGIATAGQINAMSGINSVFNWSFGAFFGDWDNSCNFMRMFLGAPGTSLTQIWAGNPSAYFHMFGLNRTIGETLIEHQWNFNYNHHNLPNPNADNYYRRVHISLMGDPTLRMEYEKPVSNVVATSNPTSGAAIISWLGSGEEQTNYLVFRAATMDDAFEQIGETAINQLSFIDASPLSGNSVYMVRAKALHTTGSGSYYNLSSGRFVDFTNSLSLNTTLSSDVVCKPANQVALLPSFSNLLSNATATVVCYVNTPTNPIFQQTITLVPNQPIQLNLPDVANGTWVKFMTTVNNFAVSPSIDSVQVLELPTSEITYEITDGMLVLNADNASNNIVEWTVNGEVVSNQSSYSFEIVSPQYSIELNCSNPCGTSSSDLEVNITALNQISTDHWNLYPNPVQGELNISSQFPFESFAISDITGRVLLQNKSTNSSYCEVVNTQLLPSGIYFCTISFNGRFSTKKLVVQ